MEKRKLFISYRSTDSARVDKIVYDLSHLKHNDGYLRFDTWQDKKNLPPASPNWWDAICSAIYECDIFVFNMSKNSLQSEVCLAELNYARSMNYPIIPIVLSGEFEPIIETGKYKIDYWDLVPEWLLKSQFVWDTGTQLLDHFLEAVTRFEENPVSRIPAKPPISPHSNESQTYDEMYNEACDYAERMIYLQAKERFLELVKRKNPDNEYSDDAVEWINLLDAYIKLDEIHGTPAEYKFESRWQEYIKQFPKTFYKEGIFDPRGYSRLLVEKAMKDEAESIASNNINSAKQRIVGTPPPHLGDLFLNREAKASELREALIGDPKCIVVFGKVGLGKSALVRHVLHDLEQNKDVVDHIIYLTSYEQPNYSDNVSIFNKLSNLVGDAVGTEARIWLDNIWENTPDKNQANINALLTLFSEKTFIVVFNNFENEQSYDSKHKGEIRDEQMRELVNSFLKTDTKSKLVFTSFNKIIFNITDTDFNFIKDIEINTGIDVVIDHKGKEKDYFIELIKNTGKRELIEASSEQIHLLRRKISCNPSALNIVVGLIRNGYELDEVLDEGMWEKEWVRKAFSSLDKTDKQLMQILAAFVTPIGETAIRFIVNQLLLDCSDPIKLDTKKWFLSEQHQVVAQCNDTRIPAVSSIPKMNGCVLSCKHPQ